jgi:ATP/maltotriose-dependent transcriptional regulator MalT
LRRLLDEAEWAGAAQLAGSVWRFWLLRGYIAEGSRWLEECLAHEQPAAADAVWAKALYGWGILLNYQGEYPRAEQALQTALTIYRRLGDRRGCAIALVGLSQAVAVPGDYASAETLCRESIALMREAGDAWGLANALWYIGNTYWMEGDHGAAKAAFEESLQLYTEIGNTSGAAYDQMNLGFVAIEAGDYRTAEQLLHSSLELASARRDKRGMTRSLWGVGESAFRQAQYAEALEAYKQCLTLLAELGDRFFIANLLESVAAVATLQQQPTAAAQLFGAAEALRDSIQAPMMPRSREAYQRNVAGVRAPLGAEAFEAAWAAGRGLSTEQAIGVALNVAPASPTPQPVAPATAAAADTSPARFGLTAREAEVLRLLARGLTDQQIAHELTISPRTVHTHINAIYGKLAVSSRSTATRFALEHRLA